MSSNSIQQRLSDTCDSDHQKRWSSHNCCCARQGCHAGAPSTHSYKTLRPRLNRDNREIAFLVRNHTIVNHPELHSMSIRTLHRHSEPCRSIGKFLDVPRMRCSTDGVSLAAHPARWSNRTLPLSRPGLLGHTQPPDGESSAVSIVLRQPYSWAKTRMTVTFLS